MKIGLIDVDGHRFPNLALMRISAYWKSKGAEVEWWLGDLFHYDIIYKSKVFSDAYSKDIPDPINCDLLVKGGTGYAISLVGGGIEKYEKSKDGVLDAEIESMRPDYSIYPEYDFAIAMTSRGCPRGCEFCHVVPKEGRKSCKVANVEDFYQGQSLIKVLDPNITACKEKRELFKQYAETGAWIDFTQGIDIRLINDSDIEDLNRIKLKQVHFAWDNPKDDLREKFKNWAQSFNKPDKGMVYCLTNFNSTMEENLYRIYTLKELGYKPYVMIYDKPHAPLEIRRLQGWCNNKILFNSTPKFEDVRWIRNTLNIERS